MRGSTFDPETIVVGIIGRPHGVKGEIKLRPFNARSDLLDGIAEVILEKDGKRENRRLRSVRPAASEFIVSFDGFEAPEAVSILTNAEVRLPREALPPLGPGEFYVEDLPGCDVVDDGGRRLGVVAGIFWNGAHDVMTVAGEAEHLIPVVPEHVVSVDTRGRKVVVSWRPVELG